MARGAAPSYSAAGIVSTASYAPAPFAPNSLVTIFGANLSTSTHGLVAADIVGNSLPVEMVSTRVYVEDVAAPLLYVSPDQINFLLPPRKAIEPSRLRVVREGLTGPEIVFTMADAAPALFISPAGFVIATHGDGSLIAPEKPAVSGEIIVIYATGLGKTLTAPLANEIPHSPSELMNRAGVRITLNGTAIDPARVAYAGVTPACAGLYQVNVVLPENSPIDPELRLFVGDVGSQAALKLPLRVIAPQLSGLAQR
jgi:uncharacterized protein (TIGR03437 family)